MWMTVGIVSPLLSQESTSPSGHIGNIRNNLTPASGILIPGVPREPKHYADGLQMIGSYIDFRQGGTVRKKKERKMEKKPKKITSKSYSGCRVVFRST